MDDFCKELLSLTMSVATNISMLQSEEYDLEYNCTLYPDIAKSVDRSKKLLLEVANSIGQYRGGVQHIKNPVDQYDPEIQDILDRYLENIVILLLYPVCRIDN